MIPLIVALWLASPREGQHVSNVYYDRGYDDGFSDGANDEIAKAEPVVKALRDIFNAVRPHGGSKHIAEWQATQDALRAWDREHD